jgi:hypothetical protein
MRINTGDAPIPPRGALERSAVLRVATASRCDDRCVQSVNRAIGVASRLSIVQTCALSLLMFSGGSLFALVVIYLSGLLNRGVGVLRQAGITGHLLNVCCSYTPVPGRQMRPGLHSGR